MFQPPRLGPGAIYLRPLDSVFRSHADLIKVAEIEPQSLWTKGSAPNSVPRGSPGELRHLQALPQRILTHGVGCPIGGTICDQQRQAPLFRAWTEALNAPWTSEHLSIFHVRGAHGEQPCGFLMPPLQTSAGVTLAADNIRRRAAVLGKPFAFETGVNYFARSECEMPDGEFFRAVAEAADCGILLDLTNLWANHKNGRADIHDVLAQLPLERVWEVHLAGLQFAHGHWLDAHAQGIDEELIPIAFEVIPNLPNLGAIIFEIAPDRLLSFGEKEFLQEMEKLNRLWDAARWNSPATNTARDPVYVSSCLTPLEWEQKIAAHMLPLFAQPRPAQPGPAQPRVARPGTQLAAADERAFSLYQILAASFRRGAVAELMENTTRLLLLGMGETELRAMLDRYIEATPPAAFPTDEALSFRRFLEANPTAIPGADDLSKFEAALIAAAADGGAHRVELSMDVDRMLGEIAAGRLPGRATERPGTVLEISVDPVPSIRAIQ